MGNIGWAIGLIIVVGGGIASGGAYFATRDAAPIVLEKEASKASENQAAAVPARDETAERGDVVLSAEERAVLPDETQTASPASPEATAPVVKEAEISARVAITDRLVSFGFEHREKKRKIDTVVLHTSYNNQGGDRYAVEKVITIWKSYEVAPHYLIDRKGKILRLVRENDVAYHAGVSKMPDGRAGVNEFSLGVEILNAEDDELTKAQYDAVNGLIAALKETYGVKHVVGHADIAAGRKTDPWNLDWKKIR